ncbi:MAG: phosphotransferase [Deltaproteobacteria bacterium]|nr:phosphotransferase [Deltaproteobacteria bacterium]
MPLSNEKTFIESWLSKNWITKEPVCIRKLFGDGSNRSFYRLEHRGQSRIVLLDRGWQFSKDYAPHQRYLSVHHLPVPKFYKVDPQAGLLLMEDLGNELLQKKIFQQRTKKFYWLKQSVILLADLHGRTFPVPKNIPAAKRKFDTTKYFEEFLWTMEHLYCKLLMLRPTASLWKSFLRPFCEKISEVKPLVFCHRDYHTRNLLLKNTKLFMIDFQDARLGCPHYDLASLLYDAYLTVSEEEREELLKIYQRSLRPYTLHKKINWETFGSDLRLIAFQRTIKAAGSFASFYTRFKKRTHLKYIIPVLLSAENLAAHGDIPPSIGTVFRFRDTINRLRSRGIR